MWLRKTMNEIEFNPDGSIKTHGEIKKEKSSGSVILNYKVEFWGSDIDCKFTIKLPEDINEKDLKDIEDWVDKKVEVEELLGIELEKQEGNKFLLVISGKGHDNRCTWCKSFRTSLKTLCNKKGIDFIQREHCKFEE